MDWDWRDGELYASLRHCDRAGLAWEWLRRDPAYRADYARANDGAGIANDGACPALRHGLVDFVDPDLPAPDARPIWHRSIDPYVLTVEALGEGSKGDHFPIETFGPMVILRICPCGMEHLLVTDGGRQIRLDIAGGTLIAGPMLQYRIAGFTSARESARTLGQLLAFRKTGRLSRGRYLRPYSLSQRINELRVCDARREGATYKEVARALFENLVPETGWRIDPVRSRIRRLRKAADMMAAGGWRSLLQ
jgi:hypothetical protein